MTPTIAEKQIIHDDVFEGERSLYAKRNLILENVRFLPGESPLKHAHNISTSQCKFMGKYPLWHSDNINIDQCHFTETTRAAIWYTQNLMMRNCTVDAPKMFRQVSHLTIENSRFPNAGETLWNCRNIHMKTVEFNGADYILMNCQNIEIDDMKLQGNYSFQDAKNIVIRNSILDSKDAFWGAENITVYDSILDGEYLGWHSKNLRLINCTIRGEQPLCYATDLVMKNCKMENTNFSFEYSTVQADIHSAIVSVRNPKGGYIRAPHIGEIIIDEHCINPGACEIELLKSEVA